MVVGTESFHLEAAPLSLGRRGWDAELGSDFKMAWSSEPPYISLHFSPEGSFMRDSEAIGNVHLQTGEEKEHSIQQTANSITEAYIGSFQLRV